MDLCKREQFLWFLPPAIYLCLSLPLFQVVYNTTKQVVDEEFHVRQAKHFCLGRFDVWDPKITTLPGIYLIAALLPVELCTLYYFRMLNLISSALNLYLLLKLVRIDAGSANTESSSFACVMKAVSLGILPPLYFFSHVFYTDTLSLTGILASYYFWRKRSYRYASVFGFCSVLIRQTNVIWIAMCAGISFCDLLVLSSKRNSRGTMKELITASSLLTRRTSFMNVISRFIREHTGYLSVLAAFGVFVLVNKSIVVGDKSAHEASLHLTQLLYFSLFCGIFGTATLCNYFVSSCTTILRYRKYYFLLSILLLGIVKYNTLVHPYLLADNRHYTFYIWNRFYGKYDWAKYVAVLPYILCLTVIYKGIEHQRAQFKLGFFAASFLSLALSKLLEIRYFIIPFVIWRLHTKNSSLKLQFLELLSYICINFVTFYIFLTKEVKWEQYEESQRIFW